MKKFIQWIRSHKIFVIIFIIILIGGGFWIYQKNKSSSTAIQYKYATVEKGDLIVTVSANGQVSTLNSLTLKPSVSGKVVYINLKNGKTVKKGEILLKIDDTDARNALINAQTNLQQAKLNLQKLEQGLAINEGNIESSYQKSQNNLKLAYEEAVDSLPNLSDNLSAVMDNNLYNIIYGNDLSTSLANVDYYASAITLFNPSAIEFSNTVKSSYEKAKTSYDRLLSFYKSHNLTYFSDPKDIETCVTLFYEASKNINDAVRAMLNLVQLYKNTITAENLIYPSKIDSHLTSLNNLFTITSNALTNVSSVRDKIQSNKENLANTSLDIENQKITIQQLEQQVITAQKNLENYTLTAPFSGILGNVANLLVGDTVSSGTNLGVLMSQQYVVELSLPEIDAAKVKIGQKANVTFDALDNYSTTGQVIDIDTVGVVSQGVVSYAAKVLLDTTDSKIKPGMSATVEIITDIHPNVLLIPRSALKQQQGHYYVSVLNTDNSLSQKEVQIGLMNGSQAEIIAGLNEGDQVVVSTINNNSISQTRRSSQRNVNIRIPGMF